MNKEVQCKYDSYPETIRPKLARLRSLILEVAAQDTSIGDLEETLKWGEPSYLTNASKSGTTIRIDWKAKHPNRYGLYVNCKTTLVDTYRTLFPNLEYEGNRAIILYLDQPFPESDLRLCINMALRYHLDKTQI